MHFSSPIAPAKRNKVMTPEQFNQVVVAITEGRYSWACVLILRFAGYNPVHFIPYRTYSRLVKENSSPHIPSNIPPNPNPAPANVVSGTVPGTADRSQNHPMPVGAAAVSTSKPFVQVNDLSHLEAIELPEHELQGGHFLSWLTDLKAADLPNFAEQKSPQAAAQHRWNWC